MVRGREGETATGVSVRLRAVVPNYSRELSKGDFSRNDIDHPAIKVRSGEVVQVSEEAAAFLVDTLEEFERVDEDTESREVTQSTDLLSSGGGTEGAGTRTGANVRDGAGARAATINR